MEVDAKIPLRINSSLKELDFLDKFTQVALHSEVHELRIACVGSVPGPKLLVAPLNNSLIFGLGLELPLQLLRHVHRRAYAQCWVVFLRLI